MEYNNCFIALSVFSFVRLSTLYTRASPDFLSVRETMACLWALPIIVSASQSPILFLPSTISGRSSILTLFIRLPRRGAVVAAMGKAKGTEWVAVQKDGKDFGFIYGSALVPMIDGTLTSPLKGILNSPSLPVCRYSINFEEKIKVVGDNQVTSDYLVPMDCKITNKAIKFIATMFITELPYLEQKKEIYQINVDLLGIPLEEDEVLSAIILYHAKKDQISFDGLSGKSMRGSAKISDQKVKSVPQALRGALVMAHSAWGKKLWAELVKQSK